MVDAVLDSITVTNVTARKYLVDYYPTAHKKVTKSRSWLIDAGSWLIDAGFAKCWSYLICKLSLVSSSVVLRLSATILKLARCGKWLSCDATSYPLISGKLISKITKSGLVCINVLTHAIPLSTQTTELPIFENNRVNASAVAASSSAITIL